MERAIVFPRMFASCSLALKANLLQETNRLMVIGNRAGVNAIEVHLFKTKTYNGPNCF